MVNQVFSVIW